MLLLDPAFLPQLEKNFLKMIKVFIIFGTRPEAIKLAPVIKEMEKYSSKFRVTICVTGQHKEMLNQVLEIFDLVPDINLNIMKKNQSLSDITIEVLRRLEEFFKQKEPDLIVVQGDTTTTFAASLAAYYARIKIAHIEAGLRSGDKYNPFPEEINRKLTDCLADFYFAPTEKAKENLINEGIEQKKIFVTGNTVIDALLTISKKIEKTKKARQIEEMFFSNYGVNLNGRRILLVTGHRRESFGPDFESICYGLKKVAEVHEDVSIVYPVHLNPNVREPVYRILGHVPNIHLLEPLDYEHFVWLMTKSFAVLTDSGGVQEEAPALGKPVLVMRKTTERPEGIEAGTACLVGVNRNNIYQKARLLLDNSEYYQKMAKAVNPYGDGRASQRIVKILDEYFS